MTGRDREGAAAADRVPANCAFTTSPFVMTPCLAVPTNCAGERPADAILCLAAGENRWVGVDCEDGAAAGTASVAARPATGIAPIEPRFKARNRAYAAWSSTINAMGSPQASSPPWAGTKIFASTPSSCTCQNQVNKEKSTDV